MCTRAGTDVNYFNAGERWVQCYVDLMNEILYIILSTFDTYETPRVPQKDITRHVVDYENDLAGPKNISLLEYNIIMGQNTCLFSEIITYLTNKYNTQ